MCVQPTPDRSNSEMVPPQMEYAACDKPAIVMGSAGYLLKTRPDLTMMKA